MTMAFPLNSVKASQQLSSTLHLSVRTCTPQSVVLEGMLMIQTPAIATMSTMQDYVKLLHNRYVKPHLIAGAIEVHVVFDHPGGLPEAPKEIEYQR